MDQLDKIAATASICAEILGNVETGDFALMPLTGESLTRPYLERVFLVPPPFTNLRGHRTCERLPMHGPF